MGIYLFVFLVGVHNVECSCEAVTEVVGSTCLKCLSVMHKSLDSVGSFCACKLVTVGLSALYNRHCERLFAEFGINVEHTLCFFDSLLSGSVDSVTLLPEELS